MAKRTTGKSKSRKTRSTSPSSVGGLSRLAGGPAKRYSER